MKTSLFALTTLFVALPVYAQDIQSEVRGNASAESSASGAGIQVSTEAGEDANAGAARENACEAQCRNDYGGSGSGGFDACVRACGAGGPASPAREVDTGTPQSEGTSLQNNQSDLDFLKGKAVSASAVEVRGWDPKQKQEFLATVKVHAEVQSGQDLENFAKGILINDQNVEEISSNEDSVEVRYRVPAKFLGIFETTLPVTVAAMKAQGELGSGVRVHFPWYRFLFGVPEEMSETSLEASVGSAVAADFDSGASDFAVYARLYSAISSVLKTKHDTVKNSINNIR
ncbi:hypothetical protein HY417_00625 [Candidatus Kaiserbacteria bacterium]|nr:hypothetical protein [Candidatus Kaiserbacteria bacterium]